MQQIQFCRFNSRSTLFAIRISLGELGARTEKFQSAFYPHCLSDWNKLDPEVRTAPSVAVFKSKLLSKIRSPAKSVFGIHDPKGLSYVSLN